MKWPLNKKLINERKSERNNTILTKRTEHRYTRNLNEPHISKDIKYSEVAYPRYPRINYIKNYSFKFAEVFCKSEK